jgi:PAS domain S-box-containing protein
LKRKKEDLPLISPTLDLPEAVQQLAAPAYVLGRDGRIRWINPSYIELLGDRRGQSFVDVVAPEHRQLARTNFARKVVGHASTIFDLRVLDRHGERLTVRVISAPLAAPTSSSAYSGSPFRSTKRRSASSRPSRT